MEPVADKEETPYELLGGDDGARALTADFYGLMDTLANGRDVPDQRLTTDIEKG